MEEAICRNENFRKAIYYGLDRAVVAEAAGIREPTFATGAYDYVLDERASVAPKPDFQKANELLARIPELEKTQFRLDYLPVMPIARRIAQEIIFQLRKLGIPADFGSNGQARVVPFSTQAPELEHNIWHSAGRSNVGGYSNPEVDRLLESAKNTDFNEEEYKRLQTVIGADCPTVPLFYHEEPVTYVKSLRALEDRMVLIRCLDDIHTWYFEAEKAVERLAANRIA